MSAKCASRNAVAAVVIAVVLAAAAAAAHRPRAAVELIDLGWFSRIWGPSDTLSTSTAGAAGFVNLQPLVNQPS